MLSMLLAEGAGRSPDQSPETKKLAKAIPSLPVGRRGQHHAGSYSDQSRLPREGLIMSFRIAAACAPRVECSKSVKTGRSRLKASRIRHRNCRTSRE